MNCLKNLKNKVAARLRVNNFLETNRLVLAIPKFSDLPEILDLRQDSEVMQFVGQGRIETETDVKRFLEIAIPYQNKYGFGFCSVFKKDSGEFIGQAGLFHLGFDEDQKDIEIAYRLKKKFWGQGYATELAEALINWGFTHLAVEKLVAIVWPGNTRSQHVLEKAGLIYQGLIHFRDKELLFYEIYKADQITIEPYNPQWLQMAINEIAQLREILPADQILDIQHVGSTAIPNLSAKPVIDLQIAVASLADIKQTAITALEKLNFKYWAENPDPTRMFFVKDMPPFGKQRTFHVHISEITNKHWIEKIAFRDYLLSHPNDAKAYEQLKIDLAQQYRHHREKYTLAKTQFIQNIIQSL
jgi:GrpB-like predicted nucleotidyltransferase (UPF0157 family)